MQSELLEQVKAYFMALQDTICHVSFYDDGPITFWAWLLYRFIIKRVFTAWVAVA